MSCVISFDDPKVVEALSVREALFWLLQFNIPELIVESDAQVVISALKSSSGDESAFGLVIEDYKTITANFKSISLFFNFRIVQLCGSFVSK